MRSAPECWCELTVWLAQALMDASDSLSPPEILTLTARRIDSSAFKRFAKCVRRSVNAKVQVLDLDEIKQRRPAVEVLVYFVPLDYGRDNGFAPGDGSRAEDQEVLQHYDNKVLIMAVAQCADAYSQWESSPKEPVLFENFSGKTRLCGPKTSSTMHTLREAANVGKRPSRWRRLCIVLIPCFKTERK